MNKNINDSYWTRMVDQIAEASTCRVKIGAIILKNKLVVGMGYNGSIHGDTHCDDDGCLFVDNHGIRGSSDSGKSCIRTIHAELNAILKTEVRGTENSGWLTCYSTYQPCHMCFQALLQIGVRKIVYKNPYKDLWRDEYYRNLDVAIKNDVNMYRIAQ